MSYIVYNTINLIWVGQKIPLVITQLLYYYKFYLKEMVLLSKSFCFNKFIIVIFTR